ncbi:MAG: phospholipase A [Georgfuchsia sp.]
MQSLLCICISAACSIARAEEPAWLACRNKTPELQLVCYQHATETYLRQNPPPPPVAAEEHAATAAGGWKLDRLWPLPAELPSSHRLANTFLQYKQNYLLLDSIHHPAAAPDSPNPLNQVPAGNMSESSEIKYQISLKAPLPVTWPWNDTLWFAYTQQSHWQAFNRADSRPFRESDYEPELIFLSHRFGETLPKLGPFTPRFLNLSYLHQSNGQSLPRSRSWNRLTAQLGSEYRLQAADEDTEEKRLAVLIRPWWRMPENAGDDDNPDITKYLGHGDIEIDYWRGRELVSALLRSRAVQLDWSFPLSDEANALNLHLQYFSGYGESLIDYNHKLHSFGVGFSLPY